MVSERVMKSLVFVCVVMMITINEKSQAAFSTAPGYTSTELHSTAGTSTVIEGLDLDGGRLYFGHTTQVKSIDTSGSNFEIVGSLGNNSGIAVVARRSGNTYTAFDTSYNSPFPYDMGYIDQYDSYVHQAYEDGIYDVAVNSSEHCYIVANPDAAGSGIFRYDWANGAITQIADVGGYSGPVAFDSADNLYYGQQSSGQILKFTPAQVAAGGLTASDGEVVLNIAAGYIGFGLDGSFYATTGWGSTLARYNLTSQSKVCDIAYGGIGKFVVDDGIYAVDTDWDGYYGTIQHIVPEPATATLLAFGILLTRRCLSHRRKNGF